ncbi:MAG: hypothetical protein GF418_10785 [Chitinivibrionales bacterium]|nr:hypothetical protein [Chitinivibrionales bacterium]MBD3396100.1 hypothetical protein [Chitinivibrionales bacterium]
MKSPAEYGAVALALMIAAGCGPQSTRLTVFESADAVPWTGLDANDKLGVFHFAVVSDRTGGARAGVFGSAVSALNLMQPAFVVSVGDLVQGYTDNRDTIIAQWREFDSLISVLDMPFFRVAGNHDIKTGETDAYWKKHFGRPYYHFLYNDVLFLCLSTTVELDTAVLDDAQVAFAQRVLGEHSDARWTFVVLHHPLWQYDKESGWDRVREALGDRGFTVFAGHRHRFLRDQAGENELYVLATTGGGWPKEGTEESAFDHIVWVTVGEHGPPTIASLLLDGIRDLERMKAVPTDRVSEGKGQEPPE